MEDIKNGIELAKDSTFNITVLITSIVLIVISFILPPTGIIDPSVLTAVGELGILIVLNTASIAILSGKTTTIKKGNTEITVQGNEDND
jgi:hypothetical protein